jgi:hypothetical protein
MTSGAASCLQRLPAGGCACGWWGAGFSAVFVESVGALQLGHADGGLDIVLMHLVLVSGGQGAASQHRSCVRLMLC